MNVPSRWRVVGTLRPGKGRIGLCVFSQRLSVVVSWLPFARLVSYNPPAGCIGGLYIFFQSSVLPTRGPRHVGLLSYPEPANSCQHSSCLCLAGLVNSVRSSSSEISSPVAHFSVTLGSHFLLASTGHPLHILYSLPLLYVLTLTTPSPYPQPAHIS